MVIAFFVVAGVIVIALALWRPDEETVARDARDGFLSGLVIVLIMAATQQLLQRTGHADYARDASLFLAAITLYLGAVALLPKHWMMTAFWRQAEKRQFLAAHSDIGKRTIIGIGFVLAAAITLPYIALQTRAVRSCQSAYAAARTAPDSARAARQVTDAARRFARFALKSYHLDCATVLAPDL